MKINSNWLQILLATTLMFGSSYCLAETNPKQKSPIIPKVISGKLSAIDLQSRVIIVSGKHIQLPPDGKVFKKIGDQVSVSVIDKNGRKTFVGFRPVAGGNPGQ